MRILLVNDDGFDEPGLRALEETFADHDTITVAPCCHHSGAGMSLNLYSPLKVRKHSENRFSVEGTPVDCVKLALGELCGGKIPDLVLSGINPGANLANNTWYSGTVAAATEAALWLIPAMAVSQEYRSEPDFSSSAAVTRELVDNRVFSFAEPGTLLNVNVPLEFTGSYTATKLGSFSREIPFTSDNEGTLFRYGPYEVQPVREAEGTDVHALREGNVSITHLAASRIHPEVPKGILSWCSRRH